VTAAEKAGPLRFFSNPIVGIIGSLASMAGLILAVYFYLQSTRHRELTYLVHPAKAIVVKAGQTSRLSVTLDGKILDRDITAAQIAFWNNGNEPIRAEHVLRSFVIRTEGGIPIVDARVRKRSRDVVDVRLDTTRITSGELKILWNILEQGDGGIVQLIFAGGPDVKISASAVLEGQSKIKGIDAPESDESGRSYENRNLVTRQMAKAYFGMSAFMFGVGAYLFFRRRRRGLTVDPRFLAIYLGAPIIIIIMAIAMWVMLVKPEPPFGF
jgi:hypothetical protein